MEGGSANDYDYVNGDPVNGFDLAGTIHWRHILQVAALVTAVIAVTAVCAACELVAIAAESATAAISVANAALDVKHKDWTGLAIDSVGVASFGTGRIAAQSAKTELKAARAVPKGTVGRKAGIRTARQSAAKFKKQKLRFDRAAWVGSAAYVHAHWKE